MSVIVCKHCTKYIDTDFDVEHEDMCGEEAIIRREAEVEIVKKRAVLDYILSLGWQDTNNEYVKEVIEDADRIAKEINHDTK